MLQRIEPFARGESAPDDAVLIIRGGPLTAQKIVEHAIRQSLEYSFQGEPMFSVSADAAGDLLALFGPALHNSHRRRR